MEIPGVLASEEIYEGRIFRVTVDRVRERKGSYMREVVHHPGSGTVVAVFDDQTVALVRQYRHAARKYLLEIPAGSRDRDESPAACAARELEEELGLTTKRLQKLAEFFVSPGFLSEKMWVYLATDLTETKQRLEEDEHLEIVRVPLPLGLQMINAGEIEDAKTIIGLQLAATHLGITLPRSTT